MTELLQKINIDQFVVALNETLFMTFTSLILSVIFGLIIGVLLFSTQSEGLYKNKVLNAGTDFIINVLRAIPFIIILILVIPFTKMLVGTMLGAKAAIPSLVIAATPFYARLAVIAFTEVDKGTIEASKAMGASKLEIITKVLIPEALPALVSGICVTGISLVSYTAMAGAIGAGGLGNLAYLYGFARRDNVVLFSATVLVIIIVFIIQGVGDYIVKKIDKR
ncbi:methionine ABC transporter permease [Anaerorhabdus sp.]|uniref:methionine ABC transporter permease n=1 Tax=Anaerorhabdus sp. TaxID=1872524 RepID=UPI002FC88245